MIEQPDPLSRPWERYATRQIAEVLHLLSAGYYESPSDFSASLRSCIESLEVEHGGILGKDDPLNHLPPPPDPGYSGPHSRLGFFPDDVPSIRIQNQKKC